MSDFYWLPFESIFSVMRYPAGESHVEAKYIPPEPITIIAPKVRNFEDICNLITANRILLRQGVEAEWFIPYFPFGRHDRRRSNLDGLELELAIGLAHELNAVTLDPHSDVLALMRHIPQRAVVNAFIDKGLLSVPDPVFVIPDAGETKKAMNWLGSAKYVQVNKHRDPRTGELSDFNVSAGNTSTSNKDLIIIDDICDAGGTFLGIANLFEGVRPRSLTLAVTHGLFTKGTEELLKKFSRIFTVGTWAPGVTKVKYRDIWNREDIV